MAHRVAPEAEAELDDIWYYTATQSGHIEIADRVIDSITDITDRFFLLAAFLTLAGVATKICAQVCGASSSGSTSSSIAWKTRGF